MPTSAHGRLAAHRRTIDLIRCHRIKRDTASALWLTKFPGSLTGETANVPASDVGNDCSGCTGIGNSLLSCLQQAGRWLTQPLDQGSTRNGLRFAQTQAAFRRSGGVTTLICPIFRAAVAKRMPALWPEELAIELCRA